MNSTVETGTSSRFLLLGGLFLLMGGIGGCDEVDGLFHDSAEEVAQIDISHQSSRYPVGEYEPARYARSAPAERPVQEEAEYMVGDRHPEIQENLRVDALQERTSTFSVDVNAASYTMMRSALNAGRLPAPASVRTEEFINFFDYDYPGPQDEPFSITMEAAPSYFGSDDHAERHLMQIGVRAKDVAIEDMKHNNLVFLVDVSGSMGPQTRLPLAKKSLQILLEHLRPTDTVAIQTYASGSDTILEPTPVSEYRTIEQAIDRLVAQGGTNGEGGIRDAYDMAERGFVEGANNRVIILTDGDFNVGKRGDDIVDMVKSYRAREIALTSVGFGRGNHNDAVMERLAREGSGNYFYIDTVDEAQRIFGSHLPSTLEIVASDVRIQVEFAEDSVKNYRLVGYEKRVLENEQFEDEATNAAEVGPGHTVTAFYELELREGALRSAQPLANVRVRYKEQLLGHSLEVRDQMKVSGVNESFAEASPAFRFAAAVAEFAAILGESQYAQGGRFDEIQTIAANARFTDTREQAEFLELVQKAQQLKR